MDRSVEIDGSVVEERILRSSAVRAQDVEASDQEATADQGRVALVADEAVVVPMTLVERDELGGAETSNGTRAAAALLGEIARKAVLAVRLLIT